MRFKIVLSTPAVVVDMPNDKGLGLFDAMHRADLYKSHNRTATFSVVNEENGDVEYQV